jgi:ubiquinone/menaquinone biosynthesis C-methylase UbiE
MDDNPQSMKEKPFVQKAFTELAPRYEEVVDGELRTFWGWSYQDFVDQLIDRTEILENQKILDIATGTSIIPRKIIKQKIPGIQIAGVDITESMLRQGQKKLSGMGINTSIGLICADAMKLPIADDSYDLVVSGLASHHMDIPLMLSEMKRVLKPGGLLSIIDAGTSPFWELSIMRGLIRVMAFVYFILKENPTRAWAEAADVTNLRTPEGWQAELRAAGFKSIEIDKLSSKYPWLPEPVAIRSITH